MYYYRLLEVNNSCQACIYFRQMIHEMTSTEWSFQHKHIRQIDSLLTEEKSNMPEMSPLRGLQYALHCCFVLNNGVDKRDWCSNGKIKELTAGLEKGKSSECCPATIDSSFPPFPDRRMLWDVVEKVLCDSSLSICRLSKVGQVLSTWWYTKKTGRGIISRLRASFVHRLWTKETCI